MPRPFLLGLVGFTMLGAVLHAHGQSSQRAQGLSPGNLDLHNVKAETVTYKGQTATRLTDTGAPDLADAGRLAIVRGTSFTDGTIEVDLTGGHRTQRP